jgi:hypothetical protein
MIFQLRKSLKNLAKELEPVAKREAAKEKESALTAENLSIHFKIRRLLCQTLIKMALWAEVL